MDTYVAVVHKDENSDFGVSFPDFPGCVTAGKTIEEAKKLAYEALELHIKGMLEDGEEIPEPSRIEDIVTSSEYLDALAFFIISIPGTKSGKKRAVS